MAFPALLGGTIYILFQVFHWPRIDPIQLHKLKIRAFKVLPMVPTIIPLVPMVPLAKTVGTIGRTLNTRSSIRGMSY